MKDEITNKIIECNARRYSNLEIARYLNIGIGLVTYRLKKLGLKSPRCLGGPVEKIGENKARCSKCKQIKNISEFSFDSSKQKKHFMLSYCKECKKKRVNKNLNSSIDRFLQFRLSSLKVACKRRDIYIKMSVSEVIDLYKKQEGLCLYTGQELEWGCGKGKNKRSLSFDRIVPSLGYIPTNVVLCTVQSNLVKNDLSLEEMEQWLPSWYEKIKELSEFEMLKEASINIENNS